MVARILRGDCIALMAEMTESSVDAIVCDPPYGLEFMGKGWDAPWKTGDGFRRSRNDADAGRDTPHGRASRASPEYRAGRMFQEWCETWAVEALRVLKPGGYLLAFGGTRTYHRLAVAIEDAGFEIRDCLAWLYGSGFPKSLDVSKAIDKAAGAEREVIGPDPYAANHPNPRGAAVGQNYGTNMNPARPLTAPATPDAERWQGWGTALKPAHEPIVLARKPLTGTVAANVLEHGTGALNVDACRIATDDRWQASGVQSAPSSALQGGADGSLNVSVSSTHAAGRWPANVCLDPEAAAMLDEQTGNVGGNHCPADHGEAQVYGLYGPRRDLPLAGYGDSGGASRFLYVAKASSAERNAGLEHLPTAEGRRAYSDGLNGARPHTAEDYEYVPKNVRNIHPTVKPIELMRWLCRLVTPPGGIVLDPFAGSGTTGCAAVLEGFQFIGCEREPEYADIAEARIAWWAQHPNGVEIVTALEQERKRQAVAATGQLKFD